MVKLKEHICPKCKTLMKYCGSRVWECKTCKICYHIMKNAIVKEEKMGSWVKRIFNGYHYDIKKWEV